VGGGSDDLALAAELVRDAGVLAARMLSDGLRTEQKTSVSDVVSAADRAAEQLIAQRLASERPGDGIVGEEGTREPGARTWYVDPIDGTYNFLSGLPLWCSALALADDRGAVLGAVYCPVTDELWTGGRARPTELNGERVRPLKDAPLSALSISTYLHPTTLPDAGARGPLLQVMEGAATVRMLGCGSLELAAVASGRLGVWAQIDVLPWDWLPGSALVMAAGGAAEVREVEGHRWHVAGSKRAVADVLELLGTHALTPDGNSD
jgi:fructose-1,6-bisphosphatase/inositol monophosphatase family enzyme